MSKEVLEYTSLLGWTQADVDKGEVLIAKFMGLVYHEKEKEWAYTGTDGVGSFVWRCGNPPYSSSWDWLIPACQKFRDNKPSTRKKKIHDALAAEFQNALYHMHRGATFYHLVTILKYNKWPRSR